MNPIRPMLPLRRVLVLCISITLALIGTALTFEARAALNEQTSVNLSFDRATPPGDEYIWRRVLGSDTPRLAHYDTWVCHSNSDPATGQCVTDPAWLTLYGETEIQLKFVEVRSRTSVILNLRAFRESFADKDPCKGWYDKKLLHSAAAYNNGCARTHTGITAYLPKEQLKRIPFGGIWEARLELKLMQWDPEVHLGTFTADFVLKVTDSANLDVYFPEHGSTPQIDLNLKSNSRAANAELSGESTLPMCLYDGYGSNSKSFTITATDKANNGASHPAGSFSVARSGRTNTNDGNRIDYTLSTKVDGKEYPLENGKPLRFQGLSNSAAKPKSLTLKNVAGTVYCVDADLTLKTAAFKQSSKEAGAYKGQVRIDFKPDTSAL